VHDDSVEGFICELECASIHHVCVNLPTGSSGAFLQTLEHRGRYVHRRDLDTGRQVIEVKARASANEKHSIAGCELKAADRATSRVGKSHSACEGVVDRCPRGVSNAIPHVLVLLPASLAAQKP
jgi:hypothetical protein